MLRNFVCFGVAPNKQCGFHFLAGCDFMRRHRPAVEADEFYSVVSHSPCERGMASGHCYSRTVVCLSEAQFCARRSYFREFAYCVYPDGCSRVCISGLIGRHGEMLRIVGSVVLHGRVHEVRADLSVGFCGSVFVIPVVPLGYFGRVVCDAYRASQGLLLWHYCLHRRVGCEEYGRLQRVRGQSGSSLGAMLDMDIALDMVAQSAAVAVVWRKLRRGVDVE